MENMFENAKFGDRYRTRDGKLAIFVNRATRHTVTLLTEKFGPEHYRSDGSNVYDRESDIVGRWEEQNNEITKYFMK